MRTRMHISGLDPLIGLTIHEYRIEKRLAEGGMGAVYLGRHVLLPESLKVIKVLLPEYATNPVIRSRFYREAEAASKLKHECILGIDNFGVLPDGQLFIMIPYLNGQPLDAYLRSRGGRLSPHRAFHIVVQLCDALDHAHARGIVHRDLKPGNVYLTETNSNPYSIKLLDFGIAKILGESTGGPKTMSGLPMGTPSYMAVEQYEHADEVTHLADLYSLAIMIWEMVTGRLPWQHPDPAVLYHLQRTVIPERPPEREMPPEWIDILHSALSVDPAARLQSARELAGALASPLPAVGVMPSGAEILAGLARHFVANAAPGDETVRNASDVNRIGPLLWPARETASDAKREPPRRDADPAPGAGDSSAQVPAAAGAQTSVMPETTLSAATGVTRRPATRRGRRWQLALAAAGATAIATLAVAAVRTRTGAGAAFSPAIATPASADAGTGAAEVPDASLMAPVQPHVLEAERVRGRSAGDRAGEGAPRAESSAAYRAAASPAAPGPLAASPTVATPSRADGAGSGIKPSKQTGAPPRRQRQRFNEDDVGGD